MPFLLDDILLFPIKGPIWIGRKLNEVAMKELLDEQGTRSALRELYMRFERGEVSEEEFEEREEQLVDRLDEIGAYKEGKQRGQ